MFKIGEFSKLSNISVRSLRHYEGLGLLMPKEIDRFTGYRYYTTDQLATANKIRMLREVGFSLESIKGLLKADNLNTARQYYELRQAEVEEELQSLRKRKEVIDLLLADMENGTNTEYFNVEEKYIPEKTVLRTRKILPSYDHVKDFWLEFLSEVNSLQITLQEPLFLRSLCLDREFKEVDVDIELQVEAAAPFPLDDPDRILTTPSVHAATVTFKGGSCMNGSSFVCMDRNRQGSGVYQSLARWLEANRYGFDGVRFNILHLLKKDGDVLNAPKLLNLDVIDPDHWINEWGFELVDRQG
jgi:DNA-binding transcriptional MerR regulator